ncbi:MAG: histidine phosphatase family protein [Actinobacteria bacterium]|nr:histidine phosphatase family protein [Actinomycetota bacterium]
MGVIHLIRHGQASWGVGDYDQLSELGERQSRVLGETLRERLEIVDLAVVGEMRRHRETAAHALAAMGSQAARAELAHAGWNEFDHERVIAVHKPAYKSKARMVADLARRKDPRRAFQEIFDASLEQWTAAGEDAGYSESWQTFGDRALAALEDLDKQLGKGGSALVFTSGGPISAVSARLLGVGPEGWLQLNRVIANASVTKIVSGRSGLSLVTFNDHAHFEGVRRELLTYR